jgi:hypothetical protein
MLLLLGSVFALVSPNPAHASDWFVATDGDNKAAGSLEKPFATVQRAQESIAPGDTVFIRGGTYRMTNAHLSSTQGIFSRITVLDKSGVAGKPITYRAYQQEKPIFDCTQVNPGEARLTAFLIKGSWLHLQGLEVTGVQVTLQSHGQSICFESQGSHNIFERLSMHDGQAIGLYHVRGADNLFLNCDAWNNWDYTSEDGKGGNVDGFGCHPTKGSTGNVFRGCRAWFNSDDGYDLIGSYESVTLENCWALYNGYTPDFKSLADGNGLKAGGYGSRPADRLPKIIPRHLIRFCVAVRNKNSGFYANHHPGGNDWTNNTASRNGANFNLLGRLLDNVTDVDGTGHKLMNNLSYGTQKALARIDAAKCELTNNSFTLDLTLTEDDFVSVNEAELLAPRQPNGDLPVVGFLRPRKDSVFEDIGAFKP